MSIDIAWHGGKPTPRAPYGIVGALDRAVRKFKREHGCLPKSLHVCCSGPKRGQIEWVEARP